MMLVRTYVAPSTIEGLGVYAEEFIPSGTLIWQLNPKFVATFSRGDIEDFPPHIREFVEKYSFPHLERNDLLVVELDNGRFMNHTEEPNTDFTEFSNGYATRDIHEGEEITCNYHEFDPTFVGTFPNYKEKPQNGHWASRN
ncbi:MAG: SET domain-containing protein-lysine N-methyltransferase [Rhodomicrobiaceae bacterium]